MAASENLEMVQTIIPHLVLKDANRTIEFYKKAFGAIEQSRLEMPETGFLLHASLKIGACVFMVSGEAQSENWVSRSPETLRGTPVTIHIYVDNADETFQNALAAGAQQIMPVADMFWGDRYGKLKDPSGHEWGIATKMKLLTPAQVEDAFKQWTCAKA